MGIETLPDVEESTEPPICALREYTSNSQGTATLSFEPCNANEKPTRAPTIHSLPSSADLHASPEPLQSLEDQIRNAHLLEPARIAELLQTDLKCVAHHCTASFLYLTKCAFQQPWTVQYRGQRAPQRDGPNSVQEVKGIAIWGILLRQVSNSLTIVCLPLFFTVMRWLLISSGSTHHHGPVLRNQ